MLLIPSAALIILTFILIVHFKNHFKLIIFRRQVNNQQKCNIRIEPIDKQKFNFSPVSFMIYNAFYILLCVVIIIIAVTNYMINDKHDIYVLLFGMDLSPKIADNTIFSVVNAEIYVYMYGICFISLWDNLHAFHKYYSIYLTTSWKVISLPKIFKMYTIYAALFVILFIIQIHLFYWVFPVIICFNFAFSFYCNYKFREMLILDYTNNNASKSDQDFTKEEKDSQFLTNAHFLWRIALICCILQSVSLGLFLGLYESYPNVLYCLGLFWSVNSAVYSASFIRTKRCFQQKCHCRSPQIGRKRIKNESSSNDTAIPKKIELPKVSNTKVGNVSGLTINTADMPSNTGTITHTGTAERNLDLSNFPTVSPSDMGSTALERVNTESHTINGNESNEFNPNLFIFVDKKPKGSRSGGISDMPEHMSCHIPYVHIHSSDDVNLVGLGKDTPLSDEDEVMGDDLTIIEKKIEKLIENDSTECHMSAAIKLVKAHGLL